MKVLALFLVIMGCCSAAEVAVTEADGQLKFSTGGQEICVYQMKPGPVPKKVDPVYSHGAHLHPVYTPSGKLVTGNHPEDHRWHRGIWLAWTKTQFGESHPDFWNMGKAGTKEAPAVLSAAVVFDELKSAKGGSCSSIHRFVDYSSGKEVDVLKENWDVQVDQLTIGDRVANVIDLKSTQRCAGDTVLKLPKYHYGGLGVRGHAEWDPVDAVAMLTSEGHDRKAGDSTKGKWVWMGGKVEGADAGLVVLIHPSNFRFPQPLRLNPKNPQLCVAPSQDGDWEIKPGEDLVLRYRILAVDGAVDAAWLESAWKGFAEK
jgi:hypothetical protein